MRTPGSGYGEKREKAEALLRSKAMTQRQLQEETGACPETVQMWFGKWRAAGVLSIKGTVPHAKSGGPSAYLWKWKE